LVFSVLRNPELSEKREYLKSNGLPNPADTFTLHEQAHLFLAQASPETEYPLPFVLENVVQCGPIFLSSAPASKQDPELSGWLGRAPTVLINLGSLFNYDEPSATEMARAIKELLGQTGVQVLWKFNKRNEFSDDFLLELSDEISAGRLRLEKWLSVDPAALLETGNIALSVHHGGANCYNEAIGYVSHMSTLGATPLT
jgi:hypothetical protein